MSYHFKRRSTRLPSMSLVDACMALQECFWKGGREKEGMHVLSAVWVYKRKENRWGWMMFFPWSPLFCYQPNLGRIRRKWDLGYVWILFIVENWKHCNKIIFRCVNSIVRHSFNKNFVEFRTCGSNKQCTRPTI